jgi:hypothetical protein
VVTEPIERSDPAEVAALAACSAADRLQVMEQLGALLSATTAELLRWVAVSDRAEDWKLDGAGDMAAWLVQALRVSSTTAREWVRTATALEQLPHLREAFDGGTLSWEQVRPGVRCTTPATDATLASTLPECSVRQIEALARQHRPRRTEEDLAAARVRRLCWRPDAELGGFRYSGFVPTAEGEQLNQVLTRMAESVGPDAATGLWEPFSQRAADALLELAHLRAAIDPDPDSVLAVVHVDADVLAGARDGNGMVGDLPISRETARRLMCDAKVEFSIDQPDGTTVGIGRASRAVPRWLRRKVAHRDGCCRFPGCGRSIRHRHHLRYWTAEGPTNADNLVGLCWLHHHLVHEGGWVITGHPDHELVFTGPAGRTLRSRPRPVDRAFRSRA